MAQSNAFKNIHTRHRPIICFTPELVVLYKVDDYNLEVQLVAQYSTTFRNKCSPSMMILNEHSQMVTITRR